MKMNPRRIVIVGAGFGGLACAKGLARTDAQVTLIDRRNYHLFVPLLYVFDFGRFRIRGRFAWLLWALVHVYLLVGFENRLQVATHWLWSASSCKKAVKARSAAISSGNDRP